MSTSEDVSYGKLLKQLYFNRTGILVLLMALGSVALLAISFMTNGSMGTFCLSLGAGILATTVYSFAQVMLTTGQFKGFLIEAISSSVQEEMTKGSDAILNNIHIAQRNFLPSESYPALNTTNPKFNRDLNNALKVSTWYIFRGMTARYAVARLALISPAPREVRLIFADPSKPGAVDFRARHEAGSGDEEAFKKARQRILDAIHMSIAGAYLTRRRYDRIEICLTPIPMVDRVEICDAEIYVARFSESKDAGYLFPSTVKFDRESFIYQMFQHDCGSLLASPYLVHFEIPGDLSEKEFLDILAKHNVPMVPEDWERAKRTFTEFRQQLKSELVP